MTWKGLTIVAALTLAGCAATETRAVDETASRLEGASADHIRQCMGEPDSIRTTGSSETWTYMHQAVEETGGYDMYGGAPGVIFHVPKRSIPRACQADLTIKDGVVTGIGFRGEAGSNANPRWACQPLLAGC